MGSAKCTLELELLGLCLGTVLLTVGVDNFHPIDKELKTLGQVATTVSAALVVRLRQRRHDQRVVHYESRVCLAFWLDLLLYQLVK